MSTSSTTPMTSMTVQEVLSVYLVCFEAAIDAIAAITLTPLVCVQRNDNLLPGVEVWTLWVEGDMDILYEDPDSLLSPPESMPKARAKLDQCDTFCSYMEPEVDRKLNELFGGRADWVRIVPRPTSVLTNGKAAPGVPMHSVLLITPGVGANRLVMDGTVEQFGWESDTWLQSWADFENTRVNPVRDWEEASEGFRQAVTDARTPIDDFLDDKFPALFAELDWRELEGLGREERVERVKRQAEEKFGDPLEWFRARHA